MRKTHYRDYATEAFRFLAREGSSQAYKNRVWNEALARAAERQAGGGGISAPTEAAITRAEKALKEAEAAILDLEAAEFALYAVSGDFAYGSEMRRAVQMVYMDRPDCPLVKGEIHGRVVLAANLIGAEERTIYRWLAKSRDIFAEKRGLRIDADIA